MACCSGQFGAGAIGGAFGLPWLRTRLGPDRLVAAGTLGTAIALALFGLARTMPVALAASALAGVSWIAVLSALNISAQVALPEWVRARGLAMFVTIMFGATTLGSLHLDHRLLSVSPGTVGIETCAGSCWDGRCSGSSEPSARGS